MGIKLDWQVESEQTQIRAAEDPTARRQRHAARRRLILLLIALVGLAALVVGGVRWRLDRMDNQLRQDLIDTVEIEVTALRLGDYANFMAIQRSSSTTFMVEQSREFEEYQRLKQVRRVDLTGNVLGVAIDDRTGRVLVEEIIDGVPYEVVWYYWYYEDDGQNNQNGWRRVPDNLEFWGDPGEIDLDLVRVTYHDMDQALAAALAPRLQDWWTRGCAILGCTTPPPTLHADIVAAKPVSVDWAAYDPWTLRIVSPLVERARTDVALAPDLELTTAEQVAGRLVRYATGDVILQETSDAAWMQSELARWLSESLVAGDGVEPGFTGSLIAQYGPGAVPTVLTALRSATTIDPVLTEVTGVAMPFLTVDQLNALDWRHFFQWRLTLETRLVGQPDSSGAFLALYDLEMPNSAGLAQTRLEDPAYAARRVPQVDSVIITRDDTSQTYAQVQTTRPEGGSTVSETIRWRLVATTWKRVD